jgi:hypothetical protein
VSSARGGWLAIGVDQVRLEALHHDIDALVGRRLSAMPAAYPPPAHEDERRATGR